MDNTERVNDGIFDPVAIKSCVMDKWHKKIWGAWQVLCGRAGILLLEIKAKDFYKNPKKG